jgi:uncharacterized UPF0160 family protein
LTVGRRFKVVKFDHGRSPFVTGFSNSFYTKILSKGKASLLIYPSFDVKRIELWGEASERESN